MSLSRLTEILKLLIEVDTTNPPGNEKGIVVLLQSLLRGAELTEFKHDEKRSSLLAEIGPMRGDRPTLTFIGHMDTVPFSRENWSYHPLKATIEAGRMYGRGSSDMKSGLACMVHLGEAFLQNPELLKANLRLIFTADEEAGGIGMRVLIEENVVSRGELLIIPEPTQMAVAYEEKGAFWFELEAFGKASHGSAPELGCNAIDSIYLFKAALTRKISAENKLVGPTTLSLNRIRGGNKVNVVPDYAIAEFDLRYPPELSMEQLTKALEESAAETAVEGCETRFKILNHRPALANNQSRLKSRIQNAMADLGFEYKEIGVRYYTDLSSFESLGNEFAIIGPGISDQAHVEDEYLEIRSLKDTYELYVNLLTKEWPNEY